MSKKLQIFYGIALYPQSPTVFGTNHTLFTYTSLSSESCQYTIIFSKLLINADFFASGIGFHFVINVFKDCIMFLFWAANVLFSFYLKQRHGLQVQSFTVNTYFISFPGKTWSRYSNINTFKISKELYIFSKITILHKKCTFQRQLRV